MTPQDMIARYAQAVAGLLPKTMRADVQAELQALLTDSLHERAGAGAPTEAMAADLLVSFGAPRDVALRYHAPAPIIEPVNARLFARLAAALLGGFGLLTVSVILSAPHASDVEWRAIADQTAQDYVTLALEILGLLVAGFWALGALRRRYPQTAAWNPRALPAVVDPDHVNRLGYGFGIVAGVCGALSIMNPEWFLDVFTGGHPPAPAVQALAYDPDFMTVRGPLLFSCLALILLMLLWVTVEGRWRDQTRRIEQGLGVTLCAIMIFCVLAGPIFQSPAAEQIMKLALSLLSGFSLADVWSKRDRFRSGRSGFDGNGRPVATSHRG